MALIEVRELCKYYRMGAHDVRALDGVTLAVKEGGFAAVMGRSGSGKTTLLQLIGCLDRPTSGTVSLRGQIVNSPARRDLPRSRREHIGFVFQRFFLIPTLTALENVMLPLKYARVSRREARVRAMELIKAVGLDLRHAHRPSELSGGEQQRVAIARALVTRPTVVLADEPTGELDSETATEIMTLVSSLNRERGQTLLVATHDAAVKNCAQDVFYLRDGKLRDDEP